MGRSNTPASTPSGCKNFLLTSVSVLACGIVLARSPAAHAQTIATNQTSTVQSTGADIYINSGVLLSGTPPISVQIPTATITNHGTLHNPSAGSGALYNQSTITLLTNVGAALISANSSGIENEGTINTLTNSGLITSTSDYGITNDVSASIGIIDNTSTGTITGPYLGIDNEGGITTVTNAGLIQSTNNVALYNGFYNAHAAIGVLSNSGTLAAKLTGIVNDGNIQTLTNAGLITSTSGLAILNASTISAFTNQSTGTILGAISNAGLIGGNDLFAAISNSGSITTITNSALIKADTFAINNSSIIGAVINTSAGTIKASTAIDNAGIIGTLSNAGLITATVTGLFNEASITTLSNAGTITSRDIAINNAGGSIGALSNTGSIHGTNGGIVTSGFIGRLANTSIISSLFDSGVDNSGSIAVLTNTGGSITGGKNGILNGTGGIGGAGTIAILTNTGLISGNERGLYNEYGTIGTLTNGGIISSTSKVAIVNSGVIGSLANSGTISAGITGIDNNGGTILLLSNTAGGLITGIEQAIGNAGLIATLTNEGAITGATAINNSGAITTLTNIGSIGGGAAGIGNKGGNIGQLTNALGASVTADFAINNSGAIGTLTNIGNLNGVEIGVGNTGFITSLANAGLIDGQDTGVANDDGGTIMLLYNAAGTIAGGTTGIYNDGFIATLTNAGSITGGEIGIGNKYATIGLLSNITGVTITGGATGVHNDSAFIGTLTNNGLISGATDYGINNAGGTITQLSNNQAGTIAGGASGIYNDGLIGTLSNAGIIASASATGIDNDGGRISTLTNTGLISGHFHGIYAQGGSIGELTNASIGTLTGTITGGGTGIYNNGFIGTLTNSGLVTGTIYAAVVNDGGNILTLTNTAAGTLIGGTAGIYNSGAGSIGTLTNAGLISAMTDAVYNNAGSIGSLANSGTISAGKTAIAISSASISSIVTPGYIGTLTNSGAITGGLGFGISNKAGTIVSLTNTAKGTISAVYYGIDQTAGNIGQLTNSGLIGGIEGIQDYAGTIGTLINNAGGTIIGSTYFGIYNLQTAYIAQLTNDGLIRGGNRGIYSAVGTIVTLTNNTGGTITGGVTGILNTDGQIGLLTNSGLINGASDGIRNFTGDFDNIYSVSTIGTLTNAGLITGDTGIDNDDASITDLTNSTIGSISGGGTGIHNELGGSIATLSNAGLISGVTGAGINNNNYIGSLSNTGTILGGGDGIADPGEIQTLTNTGIIAGTAYDGLYIYHGTIGELDNSGLINGGFSGIFNDGEITAITNGIGGTITGGGSAINSTAGGLGTLTNSGLIAGNINVYNQDFNMIGGAGTIFGTLSGGTIVLNAGDNLNLLSGNEILTDSIDGTTDEGSAPAPIGTLTNSGVLQIGYPGEPATISVNGSYAQTSGGTLNVIVTPSASSEMTITGGATLSGAVDYLFAPGTYRPKTYSYLSAGSITGSFTSENYNGAPDASTTYSADPTANLVLGANFAITNGALIIVTPSDSSIFSDQTQALAEATQQSDASLLGMAESGGAAASPACEGQAALNPGSTSNGNNANIASAIAAELCNHGGWIQADGSLGHVDGNAGAAAYNANTAGFLAGIDSVFGPAGTRLGFAIGYDETYLSDKAGGSGDMGTTRVALYGSQPLGPVLLSAVIGYGHAGNDTTRSTAIGGIKENNNLGIVSGAVQASTALPLQNFALIPSLGIRFVNVESASFTEAPNQNNAFALTGRTKNFNSVQPYATVELTTSYLTPSGFSFAPQATLGLQEEAGNLGAATNLYAADGTYFASAHTSTAPLAAIIGAGLTASKSNVAFYINYNGLIAGNWNTQSGTAGLRISF